MRKELELIETIENYLKGNLSEAEKIAFEKKINENPELKKEVELQKQVLKGIERTGLKQSAKQGLKKHKFNKGLKNWGLSGLAIAIVLTSIAYYSGANKSTVSRQMSALDKPVQKTEIVIPGDSIQLTKAVSTFDSTKLSDNSLALLDKVYSKENLKTQKFIINSKRDTILKSKSGVKIRIEKNSFVNNKGESISGSIAIDFKEALTPYDIVMANLVTKTNGKVLESGGMIYTTAKSNGSQVGLAKNKALMVSVPTKKVKRDMQIFEGSIKGKDINWVNPKPIMNGGDFEESVSVIKVDSVSIMGGNSISKNGNSSVGNVLVGNFNSFAIDNSTTYLFSLTKMGWANIDRLANDKRTKEIELITKIENKKEFKYIYSTIVFANQNMYIPGYEKKDGTYSFTHGDYETTKLPVGETAVIIATATKDDKLFLATKKITITEKQEVNLTLKEVTDPELRKILLEQIGINGLAGSNIIDNSSRLQSRK